MASMPMSEEEILQVAEQVRESFLQRHSESDKFDLRDLQRVRNDLEYVAKFTRQQSGNHDNAINQMVEALSWRHKFGVNDIHYDDIEEYLWRSGMACNHGQDKGGNNIVILNIRLHKKDSKKALALQRWIAFCFEAHCRAYPKGRMCMIFDMSGCGLSHMDMDLMRFVVNSFKIYYPDLLAVLLVFNMPWILQAAWKIIQTWLSERAATKVKFVNSDTIREYVGPEQLLAQFGGTDTWQFDYEREREVMLGLLEEVLERERREKEGDGLIQSAELHSSGMEQSPGGESEEGDTREAGEEEIEDQQVGEVEEQWRPRNQTPQETEEGAEPSRKVRFSSSLPPTRQSRYGPDDEREDKRQKMASPDIQQLLQGSASSHGFRRRQVHKLISLQTEGKGQSSPDTAEDSHIPMSAEQRASDSFLPFKNIQLNPAHEMLFSGPKDRELLCTLSLTNTSSSETAVFKIKTTAPRRYKVRPNLALVQPNAVAKVQVLLVPGATSGAVSDDKFLVQLFTISASAPVPSQNQLLSFWRGLSDKDITEHRLRCRWEKESRPSLTQHTLSPASPLPSTPPVPTSSADEIHARRELRILGDKLDRLVKMNQELGRRVHHLRNWVFLLLVLVVIFLARNTLL